MWTYRSTCYWASASGLVDGVPFGLNLGYGFGNTAAATENMLFYDGKAHKLDKVRFRIPGRKRKRRYLDLWEITSGDGRGPLRSNQHQIFGHFTGLVVLDSGEELFLKDLLGFAEEVENRW